MSGGGESVGADRVAGLVGRLVGEGFGARDETAAGGALRRAVSYEGDLTEAGVYGGGGVKEVGDEGAAAYVGRVGVAGPDAEEQNLLLLHGEQRLAGCKYRATSSVFEALLPKRVIEIGPSRTMLMPLVEFGSRRLSSAGVFVR